MKIAKKIALVDVQPEGAYYVVRLVCGAVINTDTVTLGPEFVYLPDDVAIECKQGCDPCVLLDYVSPAG